MKRVKAPKKAHTGSSKKGNGDWHVNHSSMGMGDYYGTGVRNKLGKVRDGVGMVTMSKKKIGTPPRSVV